MTPERFPRSDDPMTKTEQLQRHICILNEWIETGESPYTEKGTVIFLKSLRNLIDYNLEPEGTQ